MRFAATMLAGLALPLALAAPAAAAPALIPPPVVAVAAPASVVTTATVSKRDATFLRSAHQADLAEIALGGIAAKKGKSEAVRALGAELVADHTSMETGLTALAKDLDVTLPDTPTNAQLAWVKKYNAASEAKFDQLFVKSQLDAHRMVLHAVESEAKKGTNASVRKLATTAAPIVKAHIKALKSIKS